MKHFKQFLFNLDYRVTYLYRLYIKKIHDCDNCSYFGGCMCNHIDADGNCLGWKSAGWHPIKEWLYHRKIKKMTKQFKIEHGEINLDSLNSLLRDWE